MFSNRPDSAFLGLIGGLGPHASTRFLKTVYSIKDSYLNEQELPRLLLLSDPCIPDRTEMLLFGKEEVLYKIIKTSIEKLIAFGVDYIFILCFTFHYFMPQLTKEYGKVLSLIDIALNQVLLNKKKHLLLGTLATYQLKIFEKSIFWNAAKEFITVPTQQDQKTIYEIIHQIKIGKSLDTNLYEKLKKLSSSYEAEYLLAGCTEFHLLSNEASLKKHEINIVDPLNHLAWEIAHSNIHLLGAA